MGEKMYVCDHATDPRCLRWLCPVYVPSSSLAGRSYPCDALGGVSVQCLEVQEKEKVMDEVKNAKEEKADRPKPIMDIMKEWDAAGEIFAVLHGLDTDARQRVLAAALALLGMQTPSPPPTTYPVPYYPYLPWPISPWGQTWVSVSSGTTPTVRPETTTAPTEQ